MSELGIRIKKIRKEKSLTLQQLAGNGISKGMLSLIENGKAQPSMESLHYIAEQLGVEVSSLINGRSIEDYRTILAEIEADSKEIHWTEENDEEVIRSILARTEHLQAKLTFDTYEEIRLKEIHLLMNYYQSKELDDTSFHEVMDGYERIHVYNRLLRCYHFLGEISFSQQDYHKALQLMKEAEQRVQPHWYLVNQLSQLDLYYVLTVLYAAINDQKNTEHYLKQALAIAKNEKIFYRLDDFYRLLLIQAISMLDKEKSMFYLHKLKLLDEFSEDPLMHTYAAYCEIHYVNNIEQDYESVHSLNQAFFEEDEAEFGGFMRELFICEEAYAYYMQEDFESAIAISKDLTIPLYLNHPIDLSIFYRVFAVRALCYQSLNNIEAAKRDILYAKDGVKEYPQNVYTDFIQDAYVKIIN